MKKRRYVEIVIVLALALVVGIFLPSYISRAQEKRLLDQAVMEEAQTVRIDRTERMERKSLLEKFCFLMNEDVEYIEYVPMAEGKNMDYESALENCLVFMEWMRNMTGLAGDIDYKNEVYDKADLSDGTMGLMDSGKLYTAANTRNPAQSLIVWQFELRGGCDELYRVTLDDASGMVIGLEVFTLLAPLEELYPVYYADVIYGWGSYLEMAQMELYNTIRTDTDLQGTVDRLMRESSQARQIVAASGIDPEGISAYVEENGYIGYYEYSTSVSLEIEEKKASDAADNQELSDAKSSVPRGLSVEFAYVDQSGERWNCVMDWDLFGFRFRHAEHEDGTESAADE